LIDLCDLIQGQPSRDCLSTRIAIMNYPDDRGGPQFVGLMAERITETIDRSQATVDRSQTTVAATEFHLEMASFLGDTIVDSQCG
jgi:chemotaxis-related protein WspB